jgi:hypothetical protein
LQGVEATQVVRTCHLELKRVVGELHCPAGVLPYILTVVATLVLGLREGTRMAGILLGEARLGGSCNLMTEDSRALILEKKVEILNFEF